MKVEVHLKREALEQELRNRKRLGINTEELYLGPVFEDVDEDRMDEGMYLIFHEDTTCTAINITDIHSIVITQEKA